MSCIQNKNYQVVKLHQKHYSTILNHRYLSLFIISQSTVIKLIVHLSMQAAMQNSQSSHCKPCDFYLFFGHFVIV